MRTNGTMTVKVLDCEGVARSGGSRGYSGGQIIFSTTPQEHYFDCPIHLMLPLYGGGGGSNMTKKIFVAAPDDKAGATSTSVSREVHLPDNEAQRRAVLIEPR
ncbi:hypothetical protein F2Q69_00020031 [Brassica cretica]|uniref:Uncharacterized protein n=1 Tax=Brassica cretica TaxID=69181 RepID=A0A8S9QN60_BRACR|nr:hypothetical protein F2Q69_00020031 [Brassica cretica]